MERKDLEPILLVAVVIGASLLSYFAISSIQKQDTYMHELAHQRIFSFYGCNSTIILAEDGRSGNTTYDNCTWNKDLTNLHLLNEIVGYNLNGIFNLLAFSLFASIIFYVIIIFFLISNKTGEKSGEWEKEV